MDSLDTRVADLDRRIADLIALRETLVDIKAQAENLPQTNSCEGRCVCYLLTVDRENGKVSVQKE